MNSLRVHLSYVLTALIFMVGTYAAATNYTVSSAAQFNALNLQPCDIVTWTNGTYTNQNVIFNASGTAGNPVVLRAQTPGGVIFTGSSEMNLYGDYLIVDGFYWNGGIGTFNHVEFRREGSSSQFANNSIIRNCTFNNLVTAVDVRSRWIVLYGFNNIVENCTMMNKNSTGVLILVELSHQNSGVAGHIIRNNYFFNVPPKDGRVHAGDSEGIRIGSSNRQFVNAGVLVADNYFQDVDGESEIISNKSLGNTYRNNTFRSCRGSLTLRHGAGALVEGNYFLGERKVGSGGIRVVDQDHVIINNYMQGLNNASSTFNNGITVMGGDVASGGTSNSYQFVTNVLIAFNTIYNSDDPIYFNSERATTPPQGIIANNLIFSTNGTIVSGSVAAIGGQMTYLGNIFGGANIGITNAGITTANPNFSASGELFKPSATGAAANAAAGSYPQVVADIEGLLRPTTGKDVGAHEVSGATGIITNPSPFIDSDVGNGIGVCYITAAGTPSSNSCLPVNYNALCAPVAVTGVNVAPSSSILTMGGTQLLTATVLPSDASIVQVSWSSSNTAVATVNASGIVTAVNIGAAVITATTVDGLFTATAAIQVLAAPDCTQGTNVARNAVVMNITDEQAANPARNLVDGNINTRWSGMNFPQSAVIDLGTALTINAINFYTFQNRDYQYLIEGSLTSSTAGFSMLIDRQANTDTATVITDTFNPTMVRYVRLTVTGAATYTGPWVSVQELEVICAGVVLSIDTPVTQAVVKVYPNPFSDALTLVLPNELATKTSNYAIIDITGRLVQEEGLSNATSTIQLKNNAARGTYFLQLRDLNNRVLHVEKLLKE